MTITRVRFLHIPKTAGTTLGRILERQYSGHRMFAFTGSAMKDRERYFALSEKQRMGIKLFTGHTSIRTNIPEVDSACIITLLRDPVSRVKSYCRHVSEGKSPFLFKNNQSEIFHLDDFLYSGLPHLANLQTKALINVGAKISDATLINSIGGDNAVNLALDNLQNRVRAFGIQERFTESVAYISKSLSLEVANFQSEYTRENTRDESRLIEFQERHIKKIVELNSLDIKLYKCAKRLFNRRIRMSYLQDFLASPITVASTMLRKRGCGP